jgi:hypothetical protein
LVQALAIEPAKPRLWVATAGGAGPAAASGHHGSFLHAGMTGFLRTLANEHPDYRPTLVDLDPAAISADALLGEIVADTGETEIALRGGERFGTRLEPVAEETWPSRRRRWDPKTRMPAFRVAMSAPGSIENLVLSCIDQPEPRAGEVVIEVRAVGLNFRDVMARPGCSRRMRKRSRPGSGSASNAPASFRRSAKAWTAVGSASAWSR